MICLDIFKHITSFMEDLRMKLKYDKFTIIFVIVLIVLTSIIETLYIDFSNHSIFALMFFLISMLIVGVFSFFILKEYQQFKDLDLKIQQKKKNKTKNPNLSLLDDSNKTQS